MYGPWRVFLFLLLSVTPALLLHLLVHHFLLCTGVPRVQRRSDLPLRFRPNDGTFKILQVADMHYGMGTITRCKDVAPSEFASCSDLNTTAFLQRVIEMERPDLVVFTGDNIFGSSTFDAAESLMKAFSPVMASKLPWAAILGNHDQESTMTREELMSFISLMDYSISQVNPSDVSGNPVAIDGFGNYNIKVHGPSGSVLANTSILNLYFLDSGDRSTINGVRTYGWIRESQLLWLQEISKKLQAFFSAPAVAFFHIPIPEVRDIWYKGFTGQYQEAVATSSVDLGVLKTFISMGDVKAAFIGHDHLNDFCGDVDSIYFCYGGGFGYHAYGREGWPRRARLILAELQKDDKLWTVVENIKTWKRLDDEFLTKIDEQLLWQR